MPSYYDVALDTIDQLRADLADRDHDLVIIRRANDDLRTMYRDAVDDAVKLKRDLAKRDATIAKLRADVAALNAAIVANVDTIFANVGTNVANLDTIAQLRADLAERDATIAKWEPTFAKQHDAENPHTHRRGGPPVGHHSIEAHGVMIPVRFGKSRPAGQRDPS